MGWRLMALLYLAAFLVTLVLAYTNNLPGYIGLIPGFDKIGHVVLYFVATYLGHRALNCRHWRLGRWLFRYSLCCLPCLRWERNWCKGCHPIAPWTAWICCLAELG